MLRFPKMNRVMVIGNGGGGKTTLSFALAERYALPLIEIDALQFRPNWVSTPENELRQAVHEAHSRGRWLIDGFGPWDLIEARADLSDRIIFVDHPIWVHFWWACERQIAAALGEKRLGGPKDCDLRDVTKRMFETIWRVHEQYRPKLVELVESHKSKTIWIRSPDELDGFHESLKI
jgi:adenylate kinase family enzyme